jgi:hypothetical protein
VIPLDGSLEEALSAVEDEVRSNAPMDFTLRYSGKLPACTRDSPRTAEKHQIRCGFEDQLADLWARDRRLKDVNLDAIRQAQKSARFDYDLPRPIGGSVDRKYYYISHPGRDTRFIPLVTALRFMRCELTVTMYRHKGDAFKGGLLDSNGDIDNQLKTLFDALRMPQEVGQVPANWTHSKREFFCLLEDDSLISRLDLRTKYFLGATAVQAGHVDLHLDVRVVSESMGLNYELLFP